jgi:hypothetical protein
VSEFLLSLLLFIVDIMEKFQTSSDIFCTVTVHPQCLVNVMIFQYDMGMYNLPIERWLDSFTHPSATTVSKHWYDKTSICA